MSEDLPQGLIADLKNGGVTYDDIQEYGMNPRSFRRRKEKLPIKGVQNHPNAKKQFYWDSDDDLETKVDYTEPLRRDRATKQVISQKANEFLVEIEKQIKNYRNSLDIEWPEMSHTDNKEDIVLHRTDDHFGEEVKDEFGKIIFDSDECERRIRAIFKHAHDTIETREKMGHEIENGHVLLGGDHVTNEAIYKGQAFDLDKKIRDQLLHAISVYRDEILQLADRLDHVQVVCQPGNHGDFRNNGASDQANADDIFFAWLESMFITVAADRYNKDHGYEMGDEEYLMPNEVTKEILDKYVGVSFVKSDRSDFTNFMMRGHKGHLRHGHNVANHVGTNARKNNWRGFIHNYEADIAYRGHYHEYRVEMLDGVPIIMGPSVKPPDDFANKNSFFGDAHGYIHGVTDSNPMAWTEHVVFE